MSQFLVRPRPSAALLLTVLLSTGLMYAPVAEAKRLGGGKSYGSSRSYSSPSRSSSSYSQPSNTAGYNNSSSYTPSRSQAPAAQPQRNGIGMGTVAGAAIAAGAAGYALGHANDANAQPGVNTPAGQWSENSAAPATYPQQPATTAGSSFGWLWMLLLGGLIFFVFRKMRQRKAATAGLPSHPMGMPPQGPAGGMLNKSPLPQGPGGSGTNIFGQPVGSALPSAGPMGGMGGAYTGQQTLADGMATNEFLRDMRNRFRHLQTMNGPGSLNELRPYMTPELFAQMQGEIASNTDPAEFPQLSAQLLGSAREGTQYTASVLFTGTVIESLGASEQPFSETWHLVKSAQGQNWLLMGIEQS